MKTFFAFLVPHLFACVLFAEPPPGTAEFQELVIKSANKAVSVWPDSAVEGTKVFTEIDARRQYYMKVKPEFFSNPDWPMALANEVMNGVPATAGSDSKTQAKPQPSPASGPESHPIDPRSLQIYSYIGQTPMGHAQDNANQKFALQIAAEVEAMSKIETLNLYAVAVKTPNEVSTISDTGGDWNLERGECFPFLGFKDSGAAVRLGAAYFYVPREAVALVRLSDHPDLSKHYANILAEYRATMAANARQDALDENNALLRQLRSDTQQILSQQWFLSLQMQDAQAQQDYLWMRRR